MSAAWELHLRFTSYGYLETNLLLSSLAAFVGLFQSDGNIAYTKPALSVEYLRLSTRRTALVLGAANHIKVPFAVSVSVR